MKNFLKIVVMIFLCYNTATAENVLPPCQGEDHMQWTNCFGSYLKKDLKKELKKKEIYLGDIIISHQYIFPNKKNFILEMTFIHGFLHLLGFDHKKIKDFKIMNKEEIKILNSIS